MKKNYFRTKVKSIGLFKSRYFLNALVLTGALFNGMQAQQSYTFTTAGVTGISGPTQSQINTAYASTNLNGSVTCSGGIQSFTVPSGMSLIRIDTYGAQGGSGGGSGGLGARMSGDFIVTPGQVLKILVGQAGQNGTYQGGGGGGSYVTTSANAAICIAGGGGGGYYSTYSYGIAGAAGTVVTTGNSGINGSSSSVNALGGTGGAGGAVGTTNSSSQGSGGGGLTGNGGNGYGTTGGASFTNGGTGGNSANNTTGAAGNGGFGGGGGADWNSYAGAGGGGGYSGGGGGFYYGCGGGGGSYNSGTNQTNTSGTNSGAGKVVITELCNITLVASGTNTNGAICSGNSVTLTTNAVSNYSWSNGATTSSIVVSPTATTLYSLTATSPSACTTSAATLITVYAAAPVLTVVNTASATSGICPTKTVALTASGAVSYVWVGGSTTVTNGVAFAPTATSGYTVTGTNACGSTTAATSISIHPLPTVGAVASTASICSGATISLTGTGNATTYTWTNGATNGVSFAPSTTNTYIVTGVSALSCSATASTVVTVVTTPSVAPTSNPPTICIGQSSTLTASGATNYTWVPLGSFAGANTASISVSPTNVVNTYTIIRANANCTTTQVINVYTNQLPNVFAIADPTLVCAGKPSTLSAGGAQTYTWTSPSPNYTFTGASPVVNPPVSNVYTVVGTDVNGCQNNYTVEVQTNPNPVVSMAASASVICKGQSVTFTATGGVNYTWTSSASTNTASGNVYSDSPTGATMYNVTGDNTYTCFTTVNQIVIVNPTPTINIAVTKTLVCTGNPSTLTATGANSYSWDVNANYSVTPGVTVTPIGTTIYTVTGTYTNTQCSSTKTAQVKVFTPTITVTSPTNTCYGGNITLFASGALNSYNWNIGSGFTNPFSSIVVTPTVLTVYTVSAISASNGVNCPSTQTTSIGIFYNPTITATPQRTYICRGESVDLYGNGGTTYAWSNAQNGGTITVAPTVNTTYTVTGTDDHNCVSTGTIQVKINSCTGINELNGTAKNGLSVYPNPNNGSFNISSDAGVKLNLINELGQVIRTIELQASINYKADISDLANGVYFIVGEKDGLQIHQKIIVNK